MDGTGKLITLVVALFWLVPALQAGEVTDVEVESGADEVRFLLSLDGEVADPRVFTTEDPHRIVLELPDTDSRVSSEQIPIDVGPMQSYMTVGAGGRTRLVIDMSRSAPYEVDVVGNRVELSVETGGAAAQSTGSSMSPGGTGERYEVTGFDFRRGSEGESRVLVDVDQPGVNITVNERSGGIRVSMFDTELPADKYQRLDVSDFATPVQMITPEQRGDNVRLDIDIAGAYEHLAYQSGNQVVIEVSRPPEEEAEDRELQFFEQREYEGSRITLNFQDIQVRSVLQLIADVSDHNIVVSDSVTGSLTLRLTNVPWDQALDIVLETKNLDMRKSGNVIWIAPTNEIAEREQQILRARAERQTLEPLRTAMIPISYADADEMASLIRAASEGEDRGDVGLLSDRGSVSIDERTNTLLVNDTTERIDEIRELVEELDRPVRQVLIESRIVIARHDFNHELGVRFGVTGARQDSRGNLYSIGSRSEGLDQMNRQALINRRAGGSSTPVDIPFPPNQPAEAATDVFGDRLNVNLPVSNPAGSFGFSILAADFLLDLELSALESEGQGEVISTPRVITANQQEAYIQQGVEIPFEAVQSGNQAGAISIEWKEAVLELRVKPLITPDNRVQLDMTVKQDSVGEVFFGVPSIDKREVGTNVLVDTGQTVVLGGIFQEERNYQDQKVPVLGDVPVLGRLFRNRSTEDQKRELLIFVTPQILDDRVELD